MFSQTRKKRPVFFPALKRDGLDLSFRPISNLSFLISQNLERSRYAVPVRSITKALSIGLHVCILIYLFHVGGFMPTHHWLRLEETIGNTIFGLTEMHLYHLRWPAPLLPLHDLALSMLAKTYALTIQLTIIRNIVRLKCMHADFQ